MPVLSSREFPKIVLRVWMKWITIEIVESGKNVKMAGNLMQCVFHVRGCLCEVTNVLQYSIGNVMNLMKHFLRDLQSRFRERERERARRKVKLSWPFKVLSRNEM
jgi:hypothetical protein